MFGTFNSERLNLLHRGSTSCIYIYIYIGSRMKVWDIKLGGEHIHDSRKLPYFGSASFICTNYLEPKENEVRKFDTPPFDHPGPINLIINLSLLASGEVRVGGHVRRRGPGQRCLGGGRLGLQRRLRHAGEPSGAGAVSVKCRPVTRYVTI